MCDTVKSCSYLLTDGNVISSNGFNNNEVVADVRQLGDGAYYWALPTDFTGNKLGAYGG